MAYEYSLFIAQCNTKTVLENWKPLLSFIFKEQIFEEKKTFCSW